MTNYHNNLKQYPQLLLTLPINLQPQQPLFIPSALEPLQLTHLILHQPYKPRAQHLPVTYTDPKLKTLKFQNQSLQHFQKQQLKQYHIQHPLHYL
ncbi:aminopeptidase, partial [Staphylococcus epidermidis]|uniref:aminopeptidase n=1 Tax=Staphylococcus epidermidis TaxID=1282 RepID=UPI0011A77A6A